MFYFPSASSCFPIATRQNFRVTTLILFLLLLISCCPPIDLLRICAQPTTSAPSLKRRSSPTPTLLPSKVACHLASSLSFSHDSAPCPPVLLLPSCWPVAAVVSSSAMRRSSPTNTLVLPTSARHLALWFSFSLASTPYPPIPCSRASRGDCVQVDSLCPNGRK
jgi:hypothetical protein